MFFGATLPLFADSSVPPKPTYTPVPPFNILEVEKREVSDFYTEDEIHEQFESEEYRAHVASIRREKFPEELSQLPDPPASLGAKRSQPVELSPVQRQRISDLLRDAHSRGLSVVPGYFIVRWDRHLFPYSLKRTSTASAELVTKSGKTLNAASKELVASLGGEISHSWNLATAGFAAVLNPTQFEELREHSEIASIEPVMLLDVAYEQTNLPAGLYGLDRIDEHNISSEDVYRYARDGTGVHVYIFDTGVRETHDEFNNPNRIGAGFGNLNIVNGHGTHVAGIVAGNTYGVAKCAVIHPVFLGHGGVGDMDTPGIIDRIEWLIDEHSAAELAVANMSFGGNASEIDDWDPVGFEEALQNLIADGVVVVAAAGNGGTPAELFFPGGFEDVITVGAVSSSDVRWGNYGSIIDLFAPGVSVLSADNDHDSATATLSGTSMAAPHVSGVAARYLETNPTASHFDVRNYLVNTAVTGKLSNLNGSPDRMLFSNGWFYPFHTFEEWQNSDIPVSSNHWFHCPELGGWIWTSDIYYDTYNGWFYRQVDDTWLQLLATTPFVTFYNQKTGNLEIYQE